MHSIEYIYKKWCCCCCWCCLCGWCCLCPPCGAWSSCLVTMFVCTSVEAITLNKTKKKKQARSKTKRNERKQKQKQKQENSKTQAKAKQSVKHTNKHSEAGKVYTRIPARQIVAAAAAACCATKNKTQSTNNMPSTGQALPGPCSSTAAELQQYQNQIILNKAK